MERSYMLDTQYATQKSFGGKSVVEVWRNNLGLDYELFSYGTHVATVFGNGLDGTYQLELEDTWSYSNTTVRHVREFIQQFGWKRMTKAEIGELYGKTVCRKYR